MSPEELIAMGISPGSEGMSLDELIKQSERRAARKDQNWADMGEHTPSPTSLTPDYVLRRSGVVVEPQSDVESSVTDEQVRRGSMGY